MKRRTVVLQGAALMATTVATLSLPRKPSALPFSGSPYDWPVADLRTGGTAGLSDVPPRPRFGAEPRCEVTLSKMLGPCHTNAVPVRRDVTDGIVGLPIWVSLRIVNASSCKPIADADVEIWHADVRGVYSGRAAAMCNLGDDAAKTAGYLRGRQISDADGVVSFLTIYPGWYRGRAPHIHLRVLIDDRELLISQLLFDDVLNARIYGEHADYLDRRQPDTSNDRDFIFSTSEVQQFTFDVEKLDGGILQASYTIGLKDRHS